MALPPDLRHRFYSSPGTRPVLRHVERPQTSARRLARAGLQEKGSELQALPACDLDCAGGYPGKPRRVGPQIPGWPEFGLRQSHRMYSGTRLSLARVAFVAVACMVVLTRTAEAQSATTDFAPRRLSQALGSVRNAALRRRFSTGLTLRALSCARVAPTLQILRR
jgi:hypothetical protein